MQSCTNDSSLVALRCFQAVKFLSMLQVKKIRELSMTPSKADDPAFLSAASGIVAAGKNYYVVADDELSLGCFSFNDNKPGKWLKLFPGSLPVDYAPRKKEKPDLEAICLLPAGKFTHHGALLAVASGSKDWRNRGCIVFLNSEGAVTGEVLPLDFRLLFQFLKNKVHSLNVEGVCVNGGKLLLANRGNAKNGECALITLDLEKFLHQAFDTHSIDERCFRSVYAADLGKVRNVPLTITDISALPDSRLICTAAAEAADDAYIDGACVGSAIVVCDDKFEKIRVDLLDTTEKVEGLLVRKFIQATGTVELNLVTDADARTSVASLLSTTVTL